MGKLRLGAMAAYLNTELEYGKANTPIKRTSLQSQRYVRNSTYHGETSGRYLNEPDFSAR